MTIQLYAKFHQINLNVWLLKLVWLHTHTLYGYLTGGYGSYLIVADYVGRIESSRSLVLATHIGMATYIHIQFMATSQGARVPTL